VEEIRELTSEELDAVSGGVSVNTTRQNNGSTKNDSIVAVDLGFDWKGWEKKNQGVIGI
jgi:hypothetical protein